MKIPASLPPFLFSICLLSLAFTINKPNKNTTHKLSKSKAKKAVTEKASSYYIIIDKSDYELKVYDADGWYATYPVVFGSNDLNDKFMEGDKRTPEGNFKVLLKKIHPNWGPELLLDFPNAESMRKFNERVNKGLVPRSAKVGGGIAIHATRPQEEWTVDYYQNWTDGCISLKYSEAKDLVHSSKDKEFMDQLISLIESHLSNPEMNIDYICTRVGMSRTKLYHKIKSISGQSIGDFIRTIRLKKAAQILTHQDLSLTEAMYNVGIQTQSYFTKAFKKEFGKTPSQFLKELQR